MRLLVAVLITIASVAAVHAADTDPYSLVFADRLEYQEESDAVVWDAQGFYGGDYRKFWWKTEGDSVSGRIHEASVDLLYSRAWTAFFDWQVGLRLDDVDRNRRAALALGIQGLARYRFEVDTAFFLDSDGTLRFRGEFERDVLLTQRWVLQPRAEIIAASDDIRELEVFSGVNSLDLELRLRYEFHRKFAPFVGVSWQQSFGKAADARRAAGESSRDTTWLAGLRFWF